MSKEYCANFHYSTVARFPPNCLNNVVPSVIFSHLKVGRVTVVVVDALQSIRYVSKHILHTQDRSLGPCWYSGNTLASHL